MLLTIRTNWYLNCSMTYDYYPVRLRTFYNAGMATAVGCGVIACCYFFGGVFDAGMFFLYDYVLAIVWFVANFVFFSAPKSIGAWVKRKATHLPGRAPSVPVSKRKAGQGGTENSWMILGKPGSDRWVRADIYKIIPPADFGGFSPYLCIQKTIMIR